jgi:hypothetical protein
MNRVLQMNTEDRHVIFEKHLSPNGKRTNGHSSCLYQCPWISRATYN